MHQSQKQGAQSQTSIWSWWLKLLSTHFLSVWLSGLFSRASESVSRCSSIDSFDDSFSGSSASSVEEEVSYWAGLCQLPSLIIEMLTHLIPGLSARHELKRFCYLVAIEDEGNQNKAETMLERADRKQISQMLLTRTTITDANGRVFTAMSAYAYAFWAKDIAMLKMMERYMDGEMKAKAYEECQSIFMSRDTQTDKDDDYEILRVLKQTEPLESFSI